MEREADPLTAACDPLAVLLAWGGVLLFIIVVAFCVITTPPKNSRLESTGRGNLQVYQDLSQSIDWSSLAEITIHGLIILRDAESERKRNNNQVKY